MEKVRFGIIGAGNQGSYYAGLFANGKIENATLSCVAEIDEDKIKIFSEKYPHVQMYKDYKDMINSGLCDAILVETPHYFHPEISEYALERGIHVLCDKPAGVYALQVKELNAVAEKSNAIFGMMFNQRTNCVYRKMKEIVASGGIGELIRVNWIITDWYRTQAYYDGGSWRATWNGEGGGVLINQCPHQIDLLQWIVGESPITVRGFCQYGKWHDIEVEDEVTAFFEYKNGATGVFITTTGEAPGDNRFEISGTKGKLLCEGNKLTWSKNEVDISVHIKSSPAPYTLPECETIEVETDGKNEQHAGIINNFTAAILGKEELFVQGTEGLKSVELMNAIEFSGLKGGEKVKFPVNAEEYLALLTEKRKTSTVKAPVKAIVSDTSRSF